MTRWRKAAVAIAALALLLTGPAAAGFAAETPTPGASPSAAPTPAAQLSASTDLGEGKPGTRLNASGAGWPARVTIQASTCGNLALKGAADCNAQGAGSAVTRDDGTFQLDMTVAKPPVPCPCVIHFVSPDTTAVVDAPFVVTGQPTAAVDRTNSVRKLEAEARLTGSGPITAWLGGAAKRTYILSVTNTGTSVVTDPGVTLTVGKGSNPTDLLGTPKIGTINPGQTIQYRLPVTLNGPAFGEYKVKAYFSDVDQPFSVIASTSTYPWILFALAWLLLQPLLLGLYKRRPMYEGGEEDPFAPVPDGSPAPVPALALADDPLFADPLFADPLFADPAYDPNGAALAAAGLAGAAYATQAQPVGSGGAIVPRPASALVPNYRPVFGVNDLRAYLDPHATSAPPAVAPRIVLGGVVPRATNGDAPQY